MPRAPSRPPSQAEAGLQLTLPLFDAGVALPHRLFQHPRGNRHVHLGEHRIGYELKRARRRSIGFVVGEDGLSVSAPRWVAQGDIDTALRAKAGWIVRKLLDQGERLRRLAAARVDWHDGTELAYLGRSLRLQLGAPVPEPHLVDGGAPVLQLGLPADTQPGVLRDTVLRWLQRRALQHYAERCAHYAARLGVQARQIRLSAATTRWGSATSNGTIRLHWRLMHFSPETIDYVVVHELAHLREMNHSPAFWAVVRSVLPDFETARATLKQQTLPVFD